MSPRDLLVKDVHAPKQCFAAVFVFLVHPGPQLVTGGGKYQYTEHTFDCQENYLGRQEDSLGPGSFGWRSFPRLKFPVTRAISS
jgi:hypothetical protein